MFNVSPNLQSYGNISCKIKGSIATSRVFPVELRALPESPEKLRLIITCSMNILAFFVCRTCCKFIIIIIHFVYKGLSNLRLLYRLGTTFISSILCKKVFKILFQRGILNKNKVLFILLKKIFINQFSAKGERQKAYIL